MNFLYSPKDFFDGTPKGNSIMKECANLLFEAQERARKEKSTIVKVSKTSINTDEKKRCSEKLMDEKGWDMWEDKLNYYFTQKQPTQIRVKEENDKTFDNMNYFGFDCMNNRSYSFGNNNNTWWKSEKNSGWSFNKNFVDRFHV